MMNVTNRPEIRHKYTNRLLSLLFTIAVALPLSAQSAEPEKTIRLESKTQSRQKTMQEIREQTGYKFVFDIHAFDEKASVNFGKSPLPLSAVLDKLVEGTGQTYALDNKLIILYETGVKNAKESQQSVYVEIVGTQGKADSPAVVAPTNAANNKTTAYFIPSKQTDHTIRAFSDEPKTNYSLTPENRIGSGLYMPKAAVKTNLLYLATTTLNAGVEFGLAPKWTLDLSAAYNPFQLQKGGINLFWFVQPEARYWFCQRFEKHFIGLHGIYGRFNIGEVDFLTNTFKNHRYKGWGAGAGLSWGYHLPMSKHWAWEFTVGAGVVYYEYDRFRCYECDDFEGRKTGVYYGPTKAGISLIFMIK